MSRPSASLNNDNHEECPQITHLFILKLSNLTTGSPYCSNQSQSGSISTLLTFVAANSESPRVPRVSAGASGVTRRWSRGQQVNKAKETRRLSDPRPEPRRHNNSDGRSVARCRGPISYVLTLNCRTLLI